jgi:hypothetical protein
MLERSPARRDRRAARKARYRQRLREHRIVPADFDVGAAILDLLCRTGWLDERHCSDRHQVGRAIKAMLEEAARK